MPRIVSGVFQGYACRLVSIEGDKVKMMVSVFGRETAMDFFRKQVELDDDDPRSWLRERIAEDQAQLSDREQSAFWIDLATQPEGNACEEHDAFAAHCQRVRVAAETRA